jgi:hypothetical protein
VRPVNARRMLAPGKTADEYFQTGSGKIILTEGCLFAMIKVFDCFGFWKSRRGGVMHH